MTAHLRRTYLKIAALTSREQRFESIAGRPSQVPADGGLTNNDYFCQYFADASDLEVVLPAVEETMAYGVARLALLGSGTVADIDALPPIPEPRERFHPLTDRSAEKARFEQAVERARNWRCSESVANPP